MAGTSGSEGLRFFVPHREPAQLTRANVRYWDTELQESHIHLSTEKIGYGRGDARVRDVNYLDAGRLLEQLAGKVRNTADRRRGIADLARMFFREGKEN